MFISGLPTPNRDWSAPLQLRAGILLFSCRQVRHVVQGSRKDGEIRPRLNYHVCCWDFDSLAPFGTVQPHRNCVLDSSCGNSSFQASEDNIPCDRGDWAWLYGIALSYGPLWLCFNASIYTKLKGTSESSWFATQSLLYALAFIVTWAPSTAWSALSWNSEGHFALDFLAALFEPLAAFWNLLIFLRNRPSAHRKLLNILCCKFSEGDDEEAPPKEPIQAESAVVGDEDPKPESAF